MVTKITNYIKRKIKARKEQKYELENLEILRIRRETIKSIMEHDYSEELNKKLKRNKKYNHYDISKWDI